MKHTPKKPIIKITCNWNKYFDWLVTPSLLVGYRNGENSELTIQCRKAFGIAFLFLKLKIQITFFVL